LEFFNEVGLSDEGPAHANKIGDTVINGQTVVITKSGGSMATFYGARQYDPGLHPLNPSPGSAERFLVRVPFEVWNIDQNIQVNYEIYDRGQADPTANGFMVWNTLARMYCQILNTPYNPNSIADPTVDGDKYTWNNVWYLSTFTTGDVVKIYYDNPIQIGVDTYTFNPSKSTFANLDKAISETERINVVSAEHKDIELKRLKILIVEDDPDIRELLRFNLEKAGFNLFLAEDGAKALTLARKHAPHIILLDLMLPGVDGLEVCRLLKKDPEDGRTCGNH
jgi:CheY-like chemotaxis protein